jgi:hypothetical protein
VDVREPIPQDTLPSSGGYGYQAVTHEPPTAHAANERVVIFDTLPVPFSGPSTQLFTRPPHLPWAVRSVMAGTAAMGALRPLQRGRPRWQWSLGALGGLAHGVLRRRACEPRPSILLGGLLLTASFTVSPVLSSRPAAWRQDPGEAAAAALRCIAYAAIVGRLHDALRKLQTASWTARLFD